MPRLIILAVTLLLMLPPVARAQGQGDLISGYGEEITALQESMEATTAIGTVRARLSRAFIDSDIAFSRRYLDSWSLTLQDRWRQHESFFDTQQIALGNWRDAVAAGLITEADAEAALAPAMERIRIVAETMPFWQDDDIDRLAERAFWIDLAQEIGCCGPLYYHALEEADSVWSGAVSPAPSAVAALDLLPTVPLEEVQVIAPEVRAYAWLASRAEAMAEAESPEPGALRALLTEARLLESLYGLPGGVALDRSFSTLAAREGYAARPVAPLVRLAAITEPGYMRDALLVRASQRLQDRATHLGLVAIGLPEDATPSRSMGLGETSEVSDLPPEPAPSSAQAPAPTGDDQAAAAIGAALVTLAGDSLDIRALSEIADLAEEADDLLQPENALDILRGLDRDPLANVSR